MINRPKLSDVVRLAECGIYLTANPMDQLWDGLRDFNVAGFFPHQNNEIVAPPDLTPTWWPETHQLRDWVDHPQAFRVLEFIRYFPASRGRDFGLAIQAVAPGRTCFLVPEKWADLLIRRKKTYQEFFAWLAASNPKLNL